MLCKIANTRLNSNRPNVLSEVAAIEAGEGCDVGCWHNCLKRVAFPTRGGAWPSLRPDRSNQHALVVEAHEGARVLFLFKKKAANTQCFFDGHLLGGTHRSGGGQFFFNAICARKKEEFTLCPRGGQPTRPYQHPPPPGKPLSTRAHHQKVPGKAPPDWQ